MALARLDLGDPLRPAEERAAPLAGERAHASDLLPRIDALRRELGAQADELHAIVVGTGPGSFTGLRVGIATALGLARATGAALLGIPSFEALALAELRDGEEGTVLRNARAGRVYHARYRREGEEVRELEAPAALTLAELAGRLAGAGPILADEGLPEVLEPEALGIGPQVLGRLRLGAQPEAGALLRLGWPRLARGAAGSPADVQPLYLFAFGRGGPDPAPEGGAPPGRTR